MIDSPAIQDILQVLAELSAQLKAMDDGLHRAALLRQMRILLADADKILASEIGAII